MNYLNPSRYETLINRIVPVPQQPKQLDGAGLKLTRTTKFNVTAPTAEFGPVKTAGERVRKLFADHCGEDCFCACDEGVKITLSIEPAPFELRCPDEAYKLTVTDKGIDLVGYGEKGLLYAVISLEQINDWDIYGCEIPAMEVQDWPENRWRGIKQESRWGSDMMERDEWMAMLDDLADKKMNTVGLAIYGCWGMEYDGQVSEYCYLPIKGHPELKTPKRVKYWSAEEGRWVYCQTLPPIYRDNLMEDIFIRARDLGIQIIPGWNSYGHNTLMPTKIPDIASKDENGQPLKTGFCTANPRTYEILFSIYDQIIDEYMKPYGMTAFNLCLDEVRVWCQCEECRKKDSGQLYLDHVVKLVDYIAKRGIETVIVACDMLDPRRKKGLGREDLPKRLMDALIEKGVDRNLCLGWWSYHDHESRYSIKTMLPELNMRGYVAPWNGYHHWVIALQPLNNVKMSAEICAKDGGEGMVAYAMWDRCADRTHTAIADYSWNLAGTGGVNDVTMRYALRHFGPRAKEAYHAFRLMDWCTEERPTAVWTVPDAEHVSHWDLLSYCLTPYEVRGRKKDKPYPRSFVDRQLEILLPIRNDIERSLYSISVMGREAKEIFEELAHDSDCNYEIAMCQAYECHNYEVLAEDWLAIFEIYDLTQKGDQKIIAEIARERMQARKDLIARGERDKERCVAKSMALRQHSIFMQGFADVADYIENTENPALDLMNVRDILGDTSLWLR